MKYSLNHARSEASFFAEQGVAVHFLRPNSKKPAMGKNWSQLPVMSPDEIEDKFSRNFNIGARAGLPSKIGDHYLHVLDVDMRQDDKINDAKAALTRLLPNWEDFPRVRSGSGGESMHIYLLSPIPLSSKLLDKSKKKYQVTFAGKTTSHNEWEIELFGTGKQFVLPPSIHPVTDKPYVWEKELFDENDEIVEEAYITEQTIVAWGARESKSEKTSSIEANMKYAVGVIDLPESNIRDIVMQLPEEAVGAYEDWLNVGMAIHHQSQGAEWGRDLWYDVSEKDGTGSSLDEIQAKWDSFSPKSRPVRLFSVLKKHDIAYLVNGTREGIVPTDPNQSWLARLEATEDGKWKNCEHNVRIILEYDPTYRNCVRLNELTHRLEVWKFAEHVDDAALSTKGWYEGKEWHDTDEFRIRCALSAPARLGGYDINAGVRAVESGIMENAKANSYHPIKDNLESLIWDEKPRLEFLWIDYLGLEDTPYARETAKLFGIAAVARVFEPGIKWDHVPIIGGGQGLRKTTMVSTLAFGFGGEFNAELGDNKKAHESMARKWILELAELSQFKRSETESMKRFFTETEATFRPAYGKHSETFKRTCVFIGTTNEDVYLKDRTGNRRFWPLDATVSSIDIDRLRRNLDQLWAEAVSLYNEMRAEQPAGDLPLYLSEEARVISEDIQDAKVDTAGDTEQAETVLAWLDKPLHKGFDENGDQEPTLRDRFCAKQIWKECLGYEHGDYTMKNGAYKMRSLVQEVVKLSDGVWVKYPHKLVMGELGKQVAYIRQPKKKKTVLEVPEAAKHLI